MKNRHNNVCKGAVSLFLFVMVLGGCAETPQRQIRVWTDVPEVLDYAILFNEQSEAFDIEVEARENLLDALQSEPEAPDLLIGRYLNQAAGDSVFRDVGAVVSQAGGSQQFYPEFLALGRFDDAQRLLPVSFELSAVVFADAIDPEPDFRLSLELEAIREAAAAYNVAGPAGSERMGYSPLWHDEFARVLLEAHEVSFRRGAGGGTIWSAAPLREALSFAGSWVSDLNDGPDRSDAFQERYLTLPGVDLVKDGRVGFAFVPSSELLQSGFAEPGVYDSRWVAHNGSIAVRDTVIMAGIPRRADNRNGAEAFLRWLVDRETQRELLEGATRSPRFSAGILGGFSSLIRVNERDMLQIYPDVLGRVPPASVLRWPPRLPQMWPAMRDEAILPWVQEQIRAGDYERSPEASIEGWLRRQEVPNSPN
ncbi:MAG: hypothetical protein ACLFNQ_03810 [Spirochaetaceae bacterium]